MFPSLSPLSDLGTAGLEVKVPPPPRFRAPATNVRNVRFEPQEYARAKGDTAAKEAGLRYEEKVQHKLLDLFPGGYYASPKVSWFDDAGFRLCYPDGIITATDRVVIFEIKLQHSPEAWWQLRKLYTPVMQAKIVGLPIQVIEVVRSYDPAMPFPELVSLVADLDSYLDDASFIPSFGVLVWKL